MKSIFKIVAALFIGVTAQGANVKIVSLNLHGYHPMGESDRYLQDRTTGKLQLADSYLTYFTLDEIQRGHEKQMAALGQQLGSLRPSFVFMQEVDAGTFNTPKTCDTYTANPGDAFGTNTAWRLQNRLRQNGASYNVALACRGNTGWQTFPDTFKTQRPVEIDANGQQHVVYDYDSNPFAPGLVVEGTAILVSSDWQILENQSGWIPVTGTPDQMFIQFTRVSRSSSGPWLLLVNIHGDYKIQHFEAAITIRAAIYNFITTHPQHASFAGLIVDGDFNAQLYRPAEGTGELSTIPWEITKAGEFSYGVGTSASAYADLVQKLLAFNRDPNFESWVNLPDNSDTAARVTADVQRLQALAGSPASQGSFALTEQIASTAQRGRCALLPTAMSPACAAPNRIDQLFAGPEIHANAAGIIFSNDSFQHTVGVSDHPGLYYEADVPGL